MGEYIESSITLEKFGAENYSECFSICAEEEDVFENYFNLKDDQLEEYTKQIKPFATVDGTGRFAAFWGTEGNIENAPIIVYGSEGQIKVVA